MYFFPVIFRPSKENEPPKEEKSFEPAPPPKENAWTKRPQLSVNSFLFFPLPFKLVFHEFVIAAIISALEMQLIVYN